MTSAFSDSLMAVEAPRDLETTKGMTIKFSPHVSMQIFGNAISRHANFTKFCRIVHIDVRNEP